jgi:hypothetical protein
VDPEPHTEIPGINLTNRSSKNLNRLKIAAVLFTLGGVGLFAYFLYTVGIDELLAGIARFGAAGFAVILFIYFLRMAMRAAAWSLSVYEPYYLRFRDTMGAVIIGEAMSSMIPLGILISGTSKAVAVRNRVPMVVGLSSVATENLFYSFATSMFLIVGGLTFLRSFPLDEGWTVTIDILIAGTFALLILLFLMVFRQWHFASETCEWLYQRGHARGMLENGRLEVRLFENMIYGFYRRYPGRFLPICLIEVAYHLLGILEVWYILSRLSDAFPSLLTSFLLESVSRMISILFKLIPFVIGVDEAGAQFVGDVVALAAGVGVTLAIIRKGRIIFWTLIGLVMIIRRGLSLREISAARRH